MRKYNLLEALAFNEGTEFNIEKQEGTKYVEPIKVYGKTKKLYDAEGDEVALNSKSAQMILTKSREYVTIQDAMKASKEGNVITCILNDIEYTYPPETYGDIELKSWEGGGISPDEILKGKWFIGEDE